MIAYYHSAHRLAATELINLNFVWWLHHGYYYYGKFWLWLNGEDSTNTTTTYMA